jgi:hypothetical protein
MTRPNNADRSLTEEGAEELATNIMLYWAGKGHTVTAWVEPVARRNGVFQVRSDLINGAPRA